MTGGTAAEGTGPETGSTPQDGRIAAMRAWEASTLAAAWYARPNDLIGGWCVMPSGEPPSSGGPEVADFCTERLARHVAELHNASLAGDQVSVSREDLRWITELARTVANLALKSEPVFARLSAAAGDSR